MALMAVIAEMALVKKIMNLMVRMTLRTVKTGCNDFFVASSV